MAVSTFTAAPINDTDANFRLWGKALSDALTAVGIPMTADTGQIDWATVLKPGAGNTAQGYEIRKFNDALQASAPVLFKIEYGSATLATSPAVWMTIGVSSDGAGTLTGLLSTRKQLTCAGSSATVRDCRVCGASNRVVFAMFYSTTTYAIYSVVERTHDSGGADTAEGILIAHGATYNAVSQAYYSMTGGEGAIEATFSALVPSSGTGATGAAIALYPVFFTKGIWTNPALNILLAFAANVTANASISFTYYGSTRTFLVLPSFNVNARGPVAMSLLMRNE